MQLPRHRVVESRLFVLEQEKHGVIHNRVLIDCKRSCVSGAPTERWTLVLTPWNNELMMLLGYRIKMYTLPREMTVRYRMLHWTLVKRFGIFHFTLLKDVSSFSSAADAGL